MAVKVKFHRGAYWLFIDYKGKRQAKRVGTSEKDANDAAAKIQAKLLLGQFNIEDEEDKREPGKCMGATGRESHQGENDNSCGNNRVNGIIGFEFRQQPCSCQRAKAE